MKPCSKCRSCEAVYSVEVVAVGRTGRTEMCAGCAIELEERGAIRERSARRITTPPRPSVAA